MSIGSLEGKVQKPYGIKWPSEAIKVQGTFISRGCDGNQEVILAHRKCLHFANYPKYLEKLLTVRSSIYNLKGTDILSLPKPATTTHGLHSYKNIVR